MPNTFARLIIAVMFMAVVMSGQESVCALFKDLKAADGREITLTGDLIISKDIAALGAADCENRYSSPIESSGMRVFQMWPTALRLRPSATIPSAQLKSFRNAAIEADRLRSVGKAVNASASFSGRLRIGQAGDFPAELIFDAVDDLKVEALPEASELPVIPICELFQNLASWKGKRIAVRGESVGTFEGSWLVGRCAGAFVTNGYRWPVSLSYAGPAYYSRSTAPLAESKRPSSPPKGEETFRGRYNVVKNVTYVGRLRMRYEYIAPCREGGDYITNGFGHLNGAAAELIVEEIRDVELTKAPPHQEAEDDRSCRPANLETLCATATPLSRAASLGCIARVRELLSKDGIDSREGNASDALAQAIRSGNQAIVKMLLDAGAPLNPQKFTVWLPLAEAAWWRKIDVMKMLLQAGAKVDGTDHNGATYLAGYGYFDCRVLKVLLGAGANPNASDDNGRTALMQASNYGYEEAVVLLIENGAEVNLKDHKGRSALMYAAAGKYVDSIPHLLQHGADVHARDVNGNTALEIARASKNDVAVELLSAAMEGVR